MGVFAETQSQLEVELCDLRANISPTSCLCVVNGATPLPTDQCVVQLAPEPPGIVHQQVDLTTVTGRILDDKEIVADPERNENFHDSCSALKEYIGEDRMPDDITLLNIFGKIVVNTFSILNDDMNAIGSGLYLQLSALNHSCDPDCVVQFDGAFAVLAALRSDGMIHERISENTISYIDLLASTKERQKLLTERYYFTCTCANCMNVSKDLEKSSLKCFQNSCDGQVLIHSGLDHGECNKCGQLYEDVMLGMFMMQKAVWDMQKLTQLKENHDILSCFPYIPCLHLDTAYKYCMVVIKQQRQVLHPLNIHLVRALDFAFDVCIELQKWHYAAQFGLFTLAAYKSYYPANHPLTGLQLMKIGKILLYNGELEQAKSLLCQAYSILTVTRGADHPLCCSLVDMITQCEGEMHSRGIQN
ncbi:unnamed protein product [Soboliphyme baturini]|uniref:SET domain-containing protein n=1 Tax=Soboliphyme baturini TaxID=241478 RepID=A0A183IH06_9BILA|nr:unnamed protein product [Soboliphyme baturini]